MRKAAELGFPGVEFWDGARRTSRASRRCRRSWAWRVTQFTGWGFEPGLCNAKNHEAFVQSIGEALETARASSTRSTCASWPATCSGATLEQMHANVVTGLKRAAPLAEAPA
jgi:hypothetical protein